MADVFFNPWDEAYKYPFGACKKDSDIHLKIRAESLNKLDVTLILQGEDGREQAFSMDKLKDSDFYQIDLTSFDQIGSYSYFFQIEEYDYDNDKTYLFFYGASNPHLGQGQSYEKKEDVTPFTLTIFLSDDKAPDWYQEAIFYQIFPDSFAKSTVEKIENPYDNILFYGKSSDRPYYAKESNGDIARWTYYGGNLAGIKEKIPYLKDLGVTALYLNPIFMASSVHRYDTADYMKIDPLLGSEDNFLSLLKELHQAGMHLVLDGVFSHVGKNSIYFNYDGRFGQDLGAYQNPQSPYMDWFKFENYPDDYKSWWGIKDLPEIDKNQESFQDYIYKNKNSVIKKWTDLGVDGWRLDVADELPDFFIEGIRKSLDDYSDKVLIGEVWEDASRKVSYGVKRKYILGKSLEAVMNYPLRKMIIDFLNQKISAKDAYSLIMGLRENYPKEIFYNSFNNLGTHDTPRILTELAENTKSLELAVQMLISLPGVPCFYYGDEAGLNGQADPDNRAFFPWDNINQELTSFFKKWISYRKENKLLTSGDLLAFYTDKSLGIIRFEASSASIFIFNPSGQDDFITREHVNSSQNIPSAFLDLIHESTVLAHDVLHLHEDKLS
ncbi:glycoside hydrolase family 13 protein [Streptococcaceae bacterium ESL0729]|nr:glycoside hydrolase family 13 protein [Streptococcaceae bacterium ESL0729]